MPDPFARAALSVFSHLGSDETYTPPGGEGQAVRVIIERGTTTTLEGMDVGLSDAEPQVRVHFQRSQVARPRTAATVTDTATGTLWMVDRVVQFDEHVTIVSVREAA